MEQLWASIGVTLHIIAAIALLGFGVWLYPQRERLGAAGNSALAALVITSLHELAVAALSEFHPVTGILSSLSYLAWFWVLYRLFSTDGRHESVRPIRPVVAALAFVEMMQLGLILMELRLGLGPGAASIISELTVTFRLLCTVGALVLVHNLYVGASPAGRLTLRWPSSALATMWLYDLNFYTIAYLTGGFPETLSAVRSLMLLVMVFLLILAFSQNAAELRLRASRTVAFQSFSLLLIGAYLVSMVVIAQALAYVGSDFARLIQAGFLVAASVAALLLLPSRRLRGWLRVVVAKHLFQHRYDYRAEWLRFTETIARGGEQVLPLHERVVQSLTDITDSPSGLLLMSGESGGLTLDSRWQWHDIDVPAEALSPDAARFFEREGFILDLDDVREGRDQRGEARLMPEWLLANRKAWAIIPLLHYQRLIGVVVLSRPPIVRKLDWEDFDLLRVVGQQLASYLAEQAGQEALNEANRFDEFNRRIAFVMHDIKNLASQLSLLARNAEKHADKEEFRADMLVTLRNSSDKLNALLARLGRYGSIGNERLETINAAECVKRVAKRYESQHPVAIAELQDCLILANAEALEQALVHLVQNAIDASDEDAAVMLSVNIDGLYCRIEIIDSGAGMSTEFVRSRLFKPFHSSKPGGFGIGAFEARELVRAMHGRLDVESREGIGTRFILRLPIAAAADMIGTQGPAALRPAASLKDCSQGNSEVA